MKIGSFLFYDIPLKIKCFWNAKKMGINYFF